MTTTTIAKTSLGELRGTTENNVAIFRGVPYAAPPIAERRFGLPEKPEPWTGQRDATANAPIPPQARSRLAAAMGDFEAVQDEDCLTLTITTPAVDKRKRPVLVWLHGGAFWTGAGSLDWYSGVPLSAHGDVVVVGVNHRLGALGFMALAGISPPNLGIHDQIAALEWVKKEIEAFGGDPDNITVMGQSAGGFSILAMLSDPSVRKLFRRVIIQSAPFGRDIRSLAMAQSIGEAIQAELGIATVDDWRAANVSDIVQAQLAVAKTLAGFCQTTPPFMPVADHTLIGDNLVGTAAVGALDCDVMVGYTNDEMGAFFAQDTSIINASDEQVLSVFARFFGASAKQALDEYRQRVGGDSPRQVLGRLMSDASFAMGAQKFAQQLNELGRPAWTYRFDWQAPGNQFGACHCLELPFMFDTIDTWPSPMTEGGDPAEMATLAAQMRDAWISFARHGDPNHSELPTWSRYENSRQTMLFDRHCRLANDPEGFKRWRFWP